MLANGAKETTATTGTGTVTLSAVTGFPRFSQVLSVGQFVDYAIQDGNNWEWGVGKVAASNTLERTLVTAKFDGGAYSKNPATGLSLSGGATVFCAITDATDGYAANMDGTAIPNALHVQTSSYGANVAFVETDKIRVTPFAWPRGVDRVASGVRLRVNSTGTATKGAVALIDYGATWTTSKVLACTANFDFTTTGIKSASFPAPIAAPKARYGLALIIDGTVTLNRPEGFVTDWIGTRNDVLWERAIVSGASFSGWTTLTQSMWDSTSASPGDSNTRLLAWIMQP